ncbi:MAG: hypothetical protein SPI30_00125 [Prevotella sp.]|nr:hypothetical protein [Prevotella sp.]
MRKRNTDDKKHGWIDDVVPLGKSHVGKVTNRLLYDEGGEDADKRMKAAGKQHCQ